MRPSERNHRLRRRACASLVLAIVAPGFAAAAPEGEQVVSGEATFTRDGSLTLITTGTPQTIVNYTGFDIGLGETVRIDQPDAASRILNNVFSTDPTRINGVLTSNGQVWIANPVGVFFGDQAIVDVGRLVAGAGVADAAEFLAGTDRWSELTGRVEVGAGAQIRAADSVLLVGAAVANYGNISAADGMIALVAGGEVRLARVDGRVIVTADRAIAPDPDRWGVVQAGTLDAGKGSVSLTAGDAYSLAINHSGITRAADIAVAGGEGGVVQVSGALDASDRSAGATGGEIAVTGERVALLGARLDASGDAGGGEIRVGGDLRGEGDLPTAQRTYVDAASSLRADAIATGNGGTIIVWSDEATRFYGALSARGGAAGGDGGFAEISGASLVARGSVDLGASAGRTGTVLYDPKDIVLHAGEDPLVPGESVQQVLFGTPDELTTPFDVYELELERADANVVLQATNSVSSPETFAVALDDDSLTIQTRNNAGDEADTTLPAGIHLGGVSFSTIGGSISLSTGNGSIEVGNLTTTGANLATGGAGGNVAIAAGGTAGTITVGAIEASGGDGSEGRGGDAGTITLTAQGDVVANGALGARGGDATSGTPGGRGGLGGTVSIASESGDVTLNGPVDVGGGDGQIDTIEIVNGVPHFDGQGGSAGRLEVAVAGAGSAIAVLGDVSGVGGAGTNGAGGAGGTVTLTAGDGAIRLGNVDVSGGTGTGSVTVANGATAAQGVKGGNGGSVTVTANAGTGDDAVGGGNVLLGGTIVSRGGTGNEDPDPDLDADPNPDGGDDPLDNRENDGVGGSVRITSALDVAAAPGASGARIQAGTIAVDGRNVFESPATNLVLAAAGTGPEGTVDRATVTAGRNDATGQNDPAFASTGNIRVRLDDQDVLDRFEVIETDARGHVEVFSEAGALVAEGDGADVNGTVHTITELDTSARGEHFTYRLADPIISAGGTVEQIDITTLAVTTGAVNLGAAGGTLANARENTADPNADVLLGRIQGSGAGPHVTTAGNLQLQGTNIGDETPLSVNGSGGAPTLEITVAGNIGRVEQIDGSPLIRNEGLALDIAGSTIASVDVTQRSAAGDVAIGLPGGGRVTIDGTIDDEDGAHRFEATRITEVDTNLAGTDFFFDLDDDTRSSSAAGSGEPELTIANGAVRLDANSVAGFSTTGDLVLEGGAGSAIDAGGGTVLLAAGTNVESNGAILGANSGTPDVADAGKLVLFSAEGAGTEDAPLRISASGAAVSLAAAGGSGDVRVVNDSGQIVIEAIPLTSVTEGESETATFRGITAAGDVHLDNRNELGQIEVGREIVMGTFALPDEAPLQIPGDGPLQLPVHVQSGGDQTYRGDVVLANPKPVEVTEDGVTEAGTLDAVRLVAGGNVVFEGDVDFEQDPSDTHFASLDVSAGGTTTFAGDVGRAVGGVASIDDLTVTDVRFTEGTHTVTVASGDFRAIDGPGSLELRGLRHDPEEESVLLFRADVGANAALEEFDADADRLVFDTRTANGLTVTSADRIVAGSVELNNDPTTADNVSEVATIADTHGGLTIESGDAVTMGAGEKLSVTAVLAIRAGGTATLGDLAASELSVDASQIVVRGRPAGDVALPNGVLVRDTGVDWAANNITTNVVPTWNGVGTSPTFVLGDGGIRTGGAVPFDVVRFTPNGNAIGAESFAGHDGRTLDLVGLGPRAVADAGQDVPRAAPPVLPGLAARPGDEPPSPPREISSDELIGALHCRTPAGEPCAPPALGDDPLASERALEIRQRYRALLAGDEAQETLRAAFAPLAHVPAGDVAALSRALAHDPALDAARARVAELAVALTQVELLGLDEPESERARRAIAADFAAATGVPGLDADAVLTAVDASGVAALP